MRMLRSFCYERKLLHHYSVLADPSFLLVQWELVMVVLNHHEWILGWNCCLGWKNRLG
jgi:hypothetical protein